MKTKINRLVSYILIVSLVFMTFTNYAYAAGALNTLSVTLTNAAPGASTTHTIAFKPSVTTAIKSIYLKYCTVDGAYTDACTMPTGLALPASNGVTLTGFGSNTLTSATGAAGVETIVITTPASETIGTLHSIAIAGVTNPSAAGVFYVRIQTTDGTPGTTIDTGSAASAAIATVTVTGTQLETLTASIAGKTSGTVCSGKTMLGTTTATAITYGNFTGTTEIGAGQTLTLASNATSGVSAKVIENQLLTGPSSNTIADFGGTTDGVIGTAWSSGSTTGFGVCAKGGDSNNSGTNAYTNFGGASNGTRWMAMLTTAKSVANTTGPTSSTSTDIEYTVAVATTLGAGTYTNTLTYNILANY